MAKSGTTLLRSMSGLLVEQILMCCILRGTPEDYRVDQVFSVVITSDIDYTPRFQANSIVTPSVGDPHYLSPMSDVL